MASGYSNPLPPPARGEQQEQQSAGVASNRAFREMVMATPRPHQQQQRYAQGFAMASSASGAAAADAPKRSEEKKAPKPKKWRPAKPRDEDAAEQEQQQQQQYRDRARERREDANPDYQDAAAALQPGPTLPALQVHGDRGTSVFKSREEVTVEESKFLGGDIEHTHLVKGLDYALLQKVRTEMQKAEREQEEEAAREGAGAEAGLKRDACNYASPFGRQVHQALLRTLRPQRNSMFLPGRCAFVFDLEEEAGGGGDIPTTLHRSKADWAAVEDQIMASVDGTVLERLIKIMGYLRLSSLAGTKGRRLKRKEKAQLLGLAHELGAAAPGGAQANKTTAKTTTALPPAPAPSRAPEGDEDIFADAGTDYECKPRPKPQPTDEGAGAPEQGPAMPAPGAYFAGLPEAPPETAATAATTQEEVNAQWQQYYEHARAANDREALALYEQWRASYEQACSQGRQLLPATLQGPPPLASHQSTAALSSVCKPADEHSLRREPPKDPKEKQADFVSDTYAECYPDYQEFGNELVDSDDEDLTKMDTGKNHGHLGRQDFDNEEQWAAYNAKREALPKAAFQFGVKKSDGRKSHRAMTKGDGRDQKLATQLNQIRTIIKDKTGGKHDTAFEFRAAPTESDRAVKKKRKI